MNSNKFYMLLVVLIVNHSLVAEGRKYITLRFGQTSHIPQIAGSEAALIEQIAVVVDGEMEFIPFRSAIISPNRTLEIEIPRLGKYYAFMKYKVPHVSLESSSGEQVEITLVDAMEDFEVKRYGQTIVLPPQPAVADAEAAQ